MKTRKMPIKANLALLLLLLALGMIATTVAAFNGPGISWDVVACGGGISSDGKGVVIQDTIGQPIVGNSFNSPIELGSGYWEPLALHFNLFLPMVTR